MSSLDLNKTESISFTEDEEDYETPKTKNSYHLLELKGKGGQGEVWKARDKETGKIIALKILNVKKQRNLELAESEIETLKIISDPCYLFISCYYNYHYDPIYKQMLIEMEYIEGKNLEEFFLPFRNNPTELYKNLVFTMKDLSHALEYIHSKGVIHRDIKPENILISTKGNPKFVPKLVDFGLACESEICENRLNCCSGNSGTPVFMAPETIISRKSYFTSDVWSLGATFFKVASGNYCYNFDDVNETQAVLYTISNYEPKKLKTTNQTLNSAINSSLIKNPIMRINVKDLLKIL